MSACSVEACREEARGLAAYPRVAALASIARTWRATEVAKARVGVEHDAHTGRGAGRDVLIRPRVEHDRTP
eukprot:scaffold32972_cov28-Tisochrysis_lutea.AAC.5